MNHQFSRHYEHPARSFFSLKVALHGGRNGVGSRFRPTIYHMGSGSPENDSRPPFAVFHQEISGRVLIQMATMLPPAIIERPDWGNGEIGVTADV